MKDLGSWRRRINEKIDTFYRTTNDGTTTVLNAALHLIPGSLLLGVMALGWYFAFLSPTERPPLPSARDDWIGASYGACQQYVRQTLDTPATAQFPWRWSREVDTRDLTETPAGGRRQITGYVDAQNAAGAVVRTRFACTVTWTDLLLINGDFYLTEPDGYFRVERWTPFLGQFSVGSKVESGFTIHATLG